MKVVSMIAFVLLLIIANSELLEFGEKAVNEIFKEKRDTFILFSTAENADAKDKFS